MPSILFETVTIFILIVLNGILSMSEISVISARKIRLQQRAEAGNAGAQAALDLAENPDRFLSTVQIGITLIGILAGAFGGATLAKELARLIEKLPIPSLAAYAEAIGVGLVVLVITYLSLVIGELAPKQIGLNNPEGIAAGIAPAMRGLSRFTGPLVGLLSASTRLVLRLLGVRASSEPEVTEEEIKLLIEQGTAGGIFHPEEEEMVDQIFRLADRPILAQMTPRREIVWLDLEDPDEDIRATLKEARFSYYPVARDTIDNLVGVVQTRDLLAQCLSGKPLDLGGNMLAPLFIPESMTILETLKRLKESRSQVAFIIDEFGGLQGMSSITDILEAIAGDFPEIGEADEPEIVEREDGSYLVDGRIDIDEFKEMLDLEGLPDEDEYQTLGGFVMTCLGRVPTAGDRLEFQGLLLEVLDMDGFRVDKVLVSRSGPGSVTGE